MKKAPPLGELFFQYGFSIRIYASTDRYCVSTTGECILELNLSINLSVQCKLFALI